MISIKVQYWDDYCFTPSYLSKQLYTVVYILEKLLTYKQKVRKTAFDLEKRKETKRQETTMNR